MLVSPARSITAKVELYDGSTLLSSYKSTDPFNPISSIVIDRVGGKKFFGFGVCQDLEVKLLDKERAININKHNIFKVSFGVNDSYVDTTPLFYVYDVIRDENTNGLTVKAGDAIYYSRSHTLAEIALPTSYNISYLNTQIANLLGLTVRYEGLSEDDVSLTYTYQTPNFEGTENLRAVLDTIAEATQTIYFVNCQQELVFSRLSNAAEPVLTINKSDYFTLKDSDQVTLTKIVKATALGDNVSITVDGEGKTQYVRDNPFWELENDIGNILNNAKNAVGGLTLTQFDCDWRGNYLLEPTDKISIVTKDNKTITSYVLSDKITYTGGIKSHTLWEYADNEHETASNPVGIVENLNKTYARVDKAKQEITLQIENSISKVEGEMSKLEENVLSKVDKDIENVDAQITQLKLTTGNITATVASQEEKISTLTDSVTGLQSENKQLTEQIGSLTVKDEEILAQVSSLEQSTTTAVNNLDSKVDSVVSENAALKLTSESIQASVAKLDSSVYTVMEQVNTKVTHEDVTISIEKALEQGIESVTTKTGFTFNEEGLHVSKSGSEMTTTVTEDGIRVLRNYSEVLTANNTGVKAEDLHATTFLIIGDNSRFEDYGSRTGCFWIGGN